MDASKYHFENGADDLFHFNLDLFLLGFFRFRKDHLQHAILVRGCDLIALNIPGKPNRTGERAVASLDEMVVFLFLLFSLLLLAFNGENTIAQRDVNVLGIKDRKLGLHNEIVLCLGHIERRKPFANFLNLPSRPLLRRRNPRAGPCPFSSSQNP